MGRRIILSEEEKRNIQKLYGIIAEQGADGTEVDDTEVDDTEVDDTEVDDTEVEGEESTPDFPDNWVDGITKSGWLIQKGTHQYEGTIPNTKDAIKVVQTIVGTEPDGLFGPNTQKSVMAWQEANDLTPDGKVGKLTLAKMMGS